MIKQWRPPLGRDILQRRHSRCRQDCLIGFWDLYRRITCFAENSAPSDCYIRLRAHVFIYFVTYLHFVYVLRTVAMWSVAADVRCCNRTDVIQSWHRLHPRHLRSTERRRSDRPAHHLPALAHTANYQRYERITITGQSAVGMSGYTGWAKKSKPKTHDHNFVKS